MRHPLGFLGAVLTVAVLLVTVAAAPGAAAASGQGSAVDTIIATEPVAQWTVMVYMDGDNNLESWLTKEIDEEFATTGSTADVQVVILADRGRWPSAADGAWSGARLFRATPGMTAAPENAVADWGEVNMGSPQTLIDFVDWARASHPAEHYALFLWDHGWGWWPGETMRDDTSNDTLDVDELRDALAAVGGVDMVGMDTCLGQMIEVQAELRGFARAVAGTQDSTGYTGFSYSRIVSGLQATSATSANALAALAAESMRPGHDEWTLCSSAVRLDGRWDKLASAVSDLGWDLAVNLRKHKKAMGSARRHATIPDQVPYGEVRDLYDVVAQLRARVSSPQIKKDCYRVMVAHQRVVLSEWHTKAEGRVHGTSIYWPSSPRPPHRGASFSQWVNFIYYASELQFARLTYWPDFLSAWGG